MPLAAERSLQAGARQHGFKKGTRRYNAYVYGTMNKLGILSSNHAGALGPDKLLKGTNLDYEPTFKNVHGIHIAVVVAIIFVLAYHFRGQIFQLGLGGGGKKQAPGPNGDGASAYIDQQSYAGWIATQYNSLGAMAGALNGEAN